MKTFAPRPSFRARPLPARGGFTVLEIMVVAFIIGILATISFPVYSVVRAKAEDGNCTGNLRTLHVSFNSYTIDQHHWPQVPEEFLTDQKRLWEYVVKEVESYGALKKYWLSPTHFRQSLGARPVDERPEYWSSYIPTLFDDREASPFKWRQPWLIERGDFHGGGGKMLMPDGSIYRYNVPAP